MSTHINVVDTTLRDGNNSLSHQLTVAQAAEIARGLDNAGVKTIEVTHGDGLGGSSIQLGFGAVPDAELVASAANAVDDASIAVLYVPGVATFARLKEAHAAGATTVRVATHCTEADCSAQPISLGKELGMRVMCFLMMSHRIEPAALAEQAALMCSYGADVVYVVDSAGALVPSSAAERVAALRAAVNCPVGFHAHNNLGLAVGNTLAAIDAGATWVDGSLRGLGASAGNAQTEVLAAAMERCGHDTGLDIFRLIDIAEQSVAPILPRPQIVDGTALMVGYAGVYSTFFLFAKRAAEKYGVDSRDILLELGKRGVVGGQEDTIFDVAAELASEPSLATGA